MKYRKVKVTFNVPKIMYREYSSRIVEDGYGMRGKSFWIQEAVEFLLDLDGFEEYVSYCDGIRHFDAVDSVMLTKPAKSKIASAKLTVRKKYPSLEGVQSNIIRAAILQRLLRYT